MFTGRNRTVLLGISTLWLAGSAAGQGNLLMFDVPGFTITEAQSINEAGTIAGYYFSTGQPGRHGFIRDTAGTITSFDPPGSALTWVGGINFAGAIAGYYMDSSQQQHGFLRDPSGQFTSFDPPGGTAIVALDINDLGEITGWYTDSQPMTQRIGFLRHADGSFTTFQVSGFDTLPYKINADGMIAGILIDLSLQVIHGFVRDKKGKITHFDPKDSGSTMVNGLNGSGTIVGNYVDAAGNGYGYERGPGAHITTFQGEIPIAINDAGLITGSMSGSNGYVRSPNGQVVLFAPPPALGCRTIAPRSINGGGSVAGWCSVKADEVHSFVYKP
jgi:hypothetical protein